MLGVKAIVLEAKVFGMDCGCPFISIGGTGNYEAIFLIAVISLLFVTMQ